MNLIAIFGFFMALGLFTVGYAMHDEGSGTNFGLLFMVVATMVFFACVRWGFA